jgi:hypothetical protein
MKKSTQPSISYFGLILALCVMVISGCSCSTTKPVPPAPDPLAGFHKDYGKADQSIVTDYQNYIQNLSTEERNNVAYINFFEDGTGRHAIRIAIGLNHTDWEHVLVYDKANTRIKAIKYISGHSSS